MKYEMLNVFLTSRRIKEERNFGTTVKEQELEERTENKLVCSKYLVQNIR